MVATVPHLGDYAAAYLCCILLAHLGGELLGRVFGNGMCNLVSQDYGKPCFVLCIGQDAFVHDYLAAGHAEGIDLVVGNEVELPLEILYIVGITVLLEECLYGCGKALSHALDHSGIGLVGRELGALHVILVLLGTEAQYLCIVYQKVCLPARDGHGVGRSACRSQHGNGNNQ